MRGKRFVLLLLILSLLISLCSCGAEETPAEEPEIYTVKFDLNGGEKVRGRLTQKLEEGESASAPEVEREGYRFDGWDEDFTSVSDDLVVEAQWSKLCTVTFLPGDGTVVKGTAEQELAEGEMPDAPTVTREHYTFAGWSPEIVPVSGDASYTALWTRNAYNSEEVYAAVSPAVVELHVYDKSGNYTSLGSGFFIDDQGTIATNYHVIEGAYDVTATAYDGSVYDIIGIYAWDSDLDLALIQCSWKNPNYLTRSASAARTGETVYALGSSEGLTGTFSEGIVSTASRTVDGKNCIQITAPISHGNSGGPLVDCYGEVLGINSMIYIEGQNLNFSIKIGELDKLTVIDPITVHEFYNATIDTVTLSDYEDEGMAVYDFADNREAESNDTRDTANVLEDGLWTAGYLDASSGDQDCFSFYLGSGETAYFAYMNYYTDDDDYVQPFLYDADDNLVAEFELSDDGIWSVDFTAEKECRYYVVILNTQTDYPYSTGSYYVTGVSLS